MSNARNLARLLPNASGQLPDAAMSSGSVIQIVQSVKTDYFATNTSDSWVDVTGFSASITPSSLSNKVLVSYSAFVGQANNGNYSTHLRLVRGSTPIAIGDASGAATRSTSSSIFGALNYGEMQSCEFLDSPASLAPVTYKLQLYVEAGGGGIVGRTWNNIATYNASCPSIITLKEIAA